MKETNNNPPCAMSPELIQWFGQMLMQNFAPERQYTVAEWVDHVLEVKAAAGRKRKTICSYQHCAARIKPIIGNMKLAEVRPADISNLFVELGKSTVNRENRAVLRSGIDLLESGISKTRLAKLSGISQATVDNATKGRRIYWSKAAAIAAALDREPEDIFDEIRIEETLSGDTLNDYWRFVSLIFSVAVRELQIPFNPVERAEKASYKHKAAQTLQPEELQQVWRAAATEPVDRQALIHLMLITGGRRGEIAGLRWSRLDWERSTILIDHEILYTPSEGVYTEDGTKTGKDRLLKLPRETMDLLREYKIWQLGRKAQCGSRWIDSDYIFTGRYGGRIHPDSISGYIADFEARHRLPHIHPHKFRHTMASILIYAGVDTVTVSHRLGHAQVSTTQNTYAHLIRRADTESAECIADALIRGKKAV